jgi:hypothetical protein
MTAADGDLFNIADLRDGRLPSLSRQLSTRHGQPVRTLTLGALRGAPAEGGVPTTLAPAREKASLPLSQIAVYGPPISDILTSN